MLRSAAVLSPASSGRCWRSLLFPARVGMTAIFTGMVLALQSLYRPPRIQRRDRHSERRGDFALPRTGPGSGLIVAGRVGAAMAAEIGTMRAVTEQIDALTRFRPIRIDT